MAEVGRPSELTEELTLEIRKLVLENTSFKDIQQILDIPAGTWDVWVWSNYKDFRNTLRSWENERLIKIARANLEQLLSGDDEKIRADLTKFTLETLSKLDFSKRQETDLTSGGEKIQFQVVNYDQDHTDTTQLPA